MRRIVTPLAARWDVHVLRLDESGPDEIDAEISIHSAAFGRGPERLQGLLTDLRPQVVFVMNDLLVGGSMVAALPPPGLRPPLLGYLTIEGRVLRTEVAHAAHAFDEVAVPGRFAADELKRCWRKEGLPVRPIRIVPHGVPERACGRVHRAEARRRMFPDVPAHGFWVLNGNDISWRKCVESTLWDFADFARTRRDARLCIPRLRSGRRGHDKLLELAGRLGIRDRLLVPSSADPDWLTAQELELVYAACDVGVNTSMGEGWGMVSSEHAATGAAQIVPGHGTTAEIWGDAAIQLEPAGTTDLAGVYEMRVPRAGQLAEALADLYESGDRLNEMSCRALARSRELPSWTEVSGRFEEWFDVSMAASLRPHESHAG